MSSQFEESTFGKLSSCYLIDLPRITSDQGSLTFVEGDRHVPFDIRRVYYMYDVPGGATRGAHAHRNLYQLMISMSGSFDIELDDGHDRKTWHLNRSYFGLLIGPLIWRNLTNFSSGSVCLVLASEHYDEADYIRDYSTFLSMKNPQRV
jgi:WxcM-like, C-terminal